MMYHDKFRISAKQNYPVSPIKVLDVLFQFPTSFLCENASLCLTVLKNKSRNSLLSAENSAKNFTDTQRETNQSHAEEKS